MAKQIFDFDAEFKLGVDSVDKEHVILVNMLNTVHLMIDQGNKQQAIEYFSLTLANYVTTHFANEENFMRTIGYPQVDEHAKVHENFKITFRTALPHLATYDDVMFRAALTDAFIWIINHIGRTDRKFAQFYQAKLHGEVPHD